MARHKLGLAISKQLKADKRNQTWLADELGVSRSAVTKWLNEDGNRIAADDLVRICDKVRADKIVFFELAKEVWPKYAFEYDEKLQEFNEQPQSDVIKQDASLVKLPDLPDLKSKTCPIYFELKLGKEELIKDPSDRLERPIYEFPMWKERSEDWRKHFTETPAHTLLQQWCQNARSEQAGFHPIVGEPGGGKSTLLRSWAHKLVEMSTPTKQYLPLLVPLREVDKAGLEGFFDKQGFDVRPYLEGKTDEGVQPVWLFDGLDELPKKYKATWTKIIKAQKQHPVLLTCRTALWDSDHRVNFGEPHYLMGMYPKEQKPFLLALADEWREGERYECGFEDADDVWVGELHSKLQSQSSLKQLAGSPLLLTLIARTNKPNNIDLPAKRVEFYQKAFKELLKQREDDEVNAWTFIEPLSRLAYEVSKDELRAEFSESGFEKHTSNLSGEQITALRKSNILKFSEDGNCQWLHQTFQEWLFAEYLHANCDLLATIKIYWKNPNYYEVLVLLWGLSNSNQQLKSAQYLISEGCQVDNNGYSRSGLKTLFMIIKRNSERPKQDLQDFLLKNISTSSFKQEAIATNESTPESVIKALGNSNNPEIQWRIADNPNTPSDVLSSLAMKPDKEVRLNVAANLNACFETLNKLSMDEDSEVRQMVFENPNFNQHDEENLIEVTSSWYKSLSILTDNEKWNVAANHYTNAQVLSKLASDEDIEVRYRISSNPNTSIETLDEILKNEEDTVFDFAVANHPNASQQALTLIFHNSVDETILFAIAKNPNTPVGILETLSKSPEPLIRLGIAANQNSTCKILSVLAQDNDSQIRWKVAKNPNCCLEWF